MSTAAVARFRILVVEDHDFMRRSIVAALERDPHLTVCGEADSVSSALQEIETLQPDLVLTDLELNASCGLDLIRTLQQRDRAVRVVATTMFDLNSNEHRARSAGACDFVAKQHGPERMVEAVRRALSAGRTSAH